MTSLKKVAGSFVLVIAVFAATHVARFPGSLRSLMEVTHGQKILDMQASFSSEETYERLEAFGAAGRAAYRRTIFTVDIVFPLAVFFFLFTWGRFAADRLGLSVRARLAVLALPAAYLAFDSFENASILAMLHRFPDRLAVLGAGIGYLTRAKRIAMLGALVAPGVLLLARRARTALQA